MFITPTGHEFAETIKQKIPKKDLYLQLAEEAAELSQAANKMARKLNDSNPTPKSETDIYNNVVEEYTDVVLVASNILDLCTDDLIGNYKLYRWNKRLEEKEKEDE